VCLLTFFFPTPLVGGESKRRPSKEKKERKRGGDRNWLVAASRNLLTWEGGKAEERRGGEELGLVIPLD